MDVDYLKIFAEHATMDDVLSNSYKDLHVKGLDYICLRRTPSITLKLYFFDECDNADTPEVVCPHDHRYTFQTDVIAGEYTDILYSEEARGVVMHRYDYMTPLNGGEGFRWDERVCVAERSRTKIKTGQRLTRNYNQIHTIRVRRNTVLCLHQFGDEVPADEPTSLYSTSHKPPRLTDLYARFTPDQINRRLNQIGLPSIRE